MYTFGGVAATPLLIIGQLINLSGGSIYTWEKYRFVIWSLTTLVWLLRNFLHKIFRIQQKRQITSPSPDETPTTVTSAWSSIYRNDGLESQYKCGGAYKLNQPNQRTKTYPYYYILFTVFNKFIYQINII